MPSATPDRLRLSRTSVHLLILAALVCPTPSARGDDAPVAGIIVPIRADHIGRDAQRLELVVKKPLRRFETHRGLDPARKEVFTVICDFNPDGQASSSKEYEDCLKLARILRKLQNERGVLTVAWVHGKVSGHSVLPVLACEERVFSDENTTQFGEVVGRGTGPLEPGQETEYQQIAKERFDWPFFVQKMYDKKLAVVEVKWGVTKKSELFRALKADEPPIPNSDVILRRDDTALYNFEQASKYGLCLADPILNVQQLREHYGKLPESAVLKQPEQPTVCRIVLTGTVGGGLKEQLQRRLDRGASREPTSLSSRSVAATATSARPWTWRSRSSRSATATPAGRSRRSPTSSRRRATRPP